MPRVGIVTDSTCDLELSRLEALGVVMVPLKVLIDGESFYDWIEMLPEEFYRRLAQAQELPKTSQPTPADFSRVYEELAAAGAESIVSIHISSELSGTLGSATIAAADASVPVHVIDSHSVSQGLGLVVMAASEARAAGGDGETVARIAEETAASTRLFFVLDTLDYLVKGGRAGRAQGLAASLLNIKPILRVNEEGIIEPFRKVKGRKKAIIELAEHVAADARAHGRMRLALLHACSDEGAQELRAAIEAAGADVDIVTEGVVGSVVGTYAGPEALGCAYHPID